MSHDLVEFIVANSRYLQLYNSEDVSLGVWLSSIELHRIHDTRFDTEFRSRGCLNDYLVTHKQTASLMKLKFSYFRDTGQICSKEFKLRNSYHYNWNVPPSLCCTRNKTL